MANGSNAKDSFLEVFDRLEVGPVKIEGKRLSAPYSLAYAGKEDTFDLIYNYEEEVTRPTCCAGTTDDVSGFRRNRTGWEQLETMCF